MSGLIIVLIVAVVAVVAILAILSAVGQRYVKVGPNQALIVYGRTKTPEIITGGGKLVLPIFERVADLLAGADVLRRRAAAEPLHQPGRLGPGRGRHTA